MRRRCLPRRRRRRRRHLEPASQLRIQLGCDALVSKDLGFGTCSLGAILDELRRYDLMARNARLTSKKIARKSHELTALYGRPPTESELARAMEMNVTDYRNLVNRVGSVRVFSLDDVSSDGEGNERSFELPANGMAPDEVTSVRELREHLRDAINGLPDRQQRIIEMYYDGGMTLKQIGMQVGVTESRVCQIMGEATNKLRVMMRSEVRRG